MSDSNSTTSSSVKPGWKSTEFIVTGVVVILTLLAGSGVIPSGTAWARGVAFVLSTLAALGYTAARAATKIAALGAPDTSVTNNAISGVPLSSLKGNELLSPSK